MRKYLIFLLLACGLAHAEPFVEVRIEQTSSLPITNGSYILPQQVFATCSPHPSGKTADIRYQAEVTNPYQFNVGVGWYIQAWDYQTIGGQSSHVGTSVITPPVMQNVTPAGHHMVVNGSFLQKVTYPAGLTGPVRCYTLVMWAVASAGGGNIAVEPGYGFLQVGIRD